MPQKLKKLVWAPLSAADFAKKTELSIMTSLSQSTNNDKIKLQDHQKIIRSYLNPATPYRGILLYHGLGSGKTCSAIAISEGHKHVSKTVVFLPGKSLEDNFIHELEKCGSVEYSTSHRHWIFKELTDENKLLLEKDIPQNTLLNLNGGWVVEKGRGNFSKLSKSEQNEIKLQIKNKIEEQYSIIRYNGVSKEKLESYTREKFLDNKLVIIDEAHNVISMMTNYIGNPNDKKNNMRGRLLYNMFMSAKNTKFIFLTGTPVMNYPKELAVTFNILRGYMDIFKFTINGALNSKELKNTIQKFPYVDFLRVSYENQVEMTQTVFGFAIKDGEIFEDPFAPKDHKEWLDKFTTFVNSNGLKINLDGQLTEQFTCLPTDDRFENAFLTKNLSDIQNEDVFKRRIIGLVSYYGDKNENQGVLNDNGAMVYNKTNFPTMIVHPTEKISMSMTQYISYEKERLQEISSDTKRAMNNHIFGDEGEDTSTYRARSLALCTFTFPLSIEPCEVIKANNREKVMNDLQSQFVVYAETLREENRIDCLKELSPKYWLIKERIEKQSGTSVIYSRLKNREGLISMFTILKQCGWKRLSISQNKKTKKWTVEHGGDKTFVLYGDKDDKNRELIRKIFNSDMSDIPQELVSALPALNNYNGEIIKSLFITASGAEGVTFKNVRQLHVIEHHWSPVRIEQVIGRVNRLYSHEALPDDKRIVDVYKYETTFGEKLIEKLENDPNHNLKFRAIVAKDGYVTSDQHQIAVSERKRIINTKMLNCLKTASIDCALHKVVGCYQIDNNSYEPSFDNHLKNSSINKAPLIQLVNFEVPAKIWIPKRFHGKNMLIDEKTGQLYDKGEVKIGRPVVKATYKKETKKFVLNRKKKE